MSYKAFLVGADTLGLKYSATGTNKLAETLQCFSYDITKANQPSKSLLTAEFDNFIDSLSQTDTALIYFSGHGLMDRRKFYLLLANDSSKQGNLLNLNVMLDQFADCRAKNKLVILDCCHATKAVAELSIDFSDRYVVLASSDRLEKSIESDAFGGSFFTIEVCRTLEEMQCSNSRTLDVATLFANIIRKAKQHNLGESQHVPLPKMIGSYSDFSLIEVKDLERVNHALADRAIRESAEVEAEYRDLLLRNCDIVTLGNLPEQDRNLALRSLELRRLYVPLRAWIDIKANDDTKESDWDEIESRRQVSMGGQLQGRSYQDASERAAIGTRLADARKLVVLGDPGSGKTTLIRWLVTAYLLRNTNREAWLELPDVKTLPDLDLIPILVRCRELNTTCITGTLDDILQHTLRKAETAPARIELLQSILRERIHSGTALLMLDGLDEISDAVHRAAFCSQIERIHLAHPRAAIIVTSRIVGYREMGTRLGRGFEHLTLADLSADEKDDFAERWCALTEPPLRAAEAAKSLIHDVHSSDRIERMTGNPMLLTTMALVKRKVGKLPNRRADLYSEAVHVLLNWRNDFDHTIGVHEALPQLEYIAHSMCLLGVQRLRRTEILDLVTQFRDAYPNLHQVRAHTPEEFLKHLEANTGLIVEAGRERHGGVEELVYEFRHLTFQEFLAACALVQGHFQNRKPSTTLAENVAPLAAGTTEVAFTQDGDKEVAVAENWREALRLVATICHDDDLESFLRAILTPLPGENLAAGRARAILAVLCIADEPNVSEVLVGEIFTRFASFIDDRDRNIEIRSGAHVAAQAIARTRWAPILIKTLVSEFMRLPVLTRDYTGDVAGVVIARSALSRSANPLNWWKEQLEKIRVGDEFTAITSALGIASVAMTTKRVEMPKGIVEALFSRLKGTPPMQHAAAQALANLTWAGENKAWHPSKEELELFLGYINDSATDPEVVRFLIQIAGLELLPGFLVALLKWTTHSSVDLRRVLASTLMYFTDENATNAVIDLATKDPSSRVRETAIIELDVTKGTMFRDVFRQALRDPEHLVRAAAATALDNKENTSAVTDLVTCLSDSSTDVRLGAAYALGAIGSKKAVRPLLKLLNDENLDVRIATIRALGRIGIKGAWKHLAELAEDAEVAIRASTATALGALRAPQGLTTLTAMLSDTDRDVREFAVAAIAKVGGDRSFDTLFPLLGNPNEELRSQVARGLAKMTPSPSVASLTKLLTDGDLNQQCGAAELLGRMGALEATPLLVQKLATDEATLRRAVILGLRFLQDPHTESALIAELKRDDEEKHFVIDALGRIKSARAVGRLIELATDNDSDFQVSAIEALGRIGSASARKILLKLLRADSAFIRSCALEALCFEEDELCKKALTKNCDGRWPYIDPSAIFTMHAVRGIARITGTKTQEVIGHFEALKTKYRLRLAWTSTLSVRSASKQIDPDNLAERAFNARQAA